MSVTELRSGIETVANPRFGEYVAGRGRVGFDLLPQVAHEHAKIFILFYVIAAPHGGEESTVCEDLSGVFNEVCK